MRALLKRGHEGSAHSICRIVSSDYLDKDVYLNIRAFYRAAGYRLISPGVKSDRHADLLVVLRGDNGSEYRDFRGEIHVFDYVKEYDVDWGRRYPRASRITVVSLAGSSHKESDDSIEASGDQRIVLLDAYLPVVPSLWTCRWRDKRPRPVHVSNFKRMGLDSYQRDLLALIQAGAVDAYGGHWNLVGVQTHPLSYLQANRMLAASACCFGLMWPYQRGLTLSGRMWQAPLNGCFVFSEIGTDILGCPGVLEHEAFDAEVASQVFSIQACRQLASDAAEFWEAHTRSLAAGLGLNPSLSISGPAFRPERIRLLLWDLDFRRQSLVDAVRARVAPPLVRIRRWLARHARRLGIHPGSIRSGRSRP